MLLFTVLLEYQSVPDVIVQVLQGVNILAHNLTNLDSLSKIYIGYIYSNINNVLQQNYDFNNDEIMEQYVSLIKSLAITIRPSSFDYFIVGSTCPIFTQAILFYNHGESLIKTACRTAALSIMKCKWYIVKHPIILELVRSSGFLTNFVCLIKDQLIAIDKQLKGQVQSSYSTPKLQKIEQSMDEIIDNLYYINDIVDLDIPEINNILGEALLKHLLCAHIISAICVDKVLEHHISLQLGMYFLSLYLSIIRFPGIINTIAAIFLLPEVSPELLTLPHLHPQPPLSNYSYTCRPYVMQNFPGVELGNGAETLKIGQAMVDHVDNIEKLHDLKRNPNREVFLSFLRVSDIQSRDDNLLSLALYILQAIAINPCTSKQLLQTAGILPQQHKRRQALLDSILDEPSDEEGRKSSYDVVAIELILDIFSIQFRFRLVTYRLACKLLYSFTYDGRSNKYLLANHERVLNNVYLNVIYQIKELLSNGQFQDVFMEYFDKEWNAVKNVNFNERISGGTYLLFPLDFENNLHIDFTQRLPFGDFENVRYVLHQFFLIRKIKWILTHEQIPNDSPPDENPLQAVKTPPVWEVNKSYDISKFQIGQHTSVRCDAQEGLVSATRLLIEDPEYFVLTEPDINTAHTARVSFQSNLRNLEAMIDRSDPRTLIVAIKDQNTSKHMNLIFEDSQRCLWAKRNLERNRQQSQQRDLELMIRMLDNLEVALIGHNQY